MYAGVLISIVLVLVGVGVYQSLKVKTKDDFLVAGRKLAWPVLVFTLVSSWVGSGSLFGGAENAVERGFSALWMPAGGWVGLLVIYFVAARARRFAQYTVPDLLEARYDKYSRLFGTVAIVIAYVAIVSYQFKGGGDILHVIFPDNITSTQGMYIIAGFVILFTAMAGMSSIAYLDLILGLLVTVTAIIGLPLLVGAAGGWAEVKAALPASHFTVMGDLHWYEALNFLLPTMLLLIGNQTMYQKFFAARSERDAKLSVSGWFVGILVLETLIVALAVVGSSMFQGVPPRAIIPVAARSGLPVLLGALLLGGIFGQVIATANNFLFSPASNLIHDVYHRFLRPTAGDREILQWSRGIVVALGAIALVLAAYTESILNMALYAYTVYGAGVTPVVMAAFFWKRANRQGALASILAGTLMTIGWDIFLRQGLITGIWASLDAVIPAVTASVVALVVVSLLTPPPPPEKWQAVMSGEA